MPRLTDTRRFTHPAGARAAVRSLEAGGFTPPEIQLTPAQAPAAFSCARKLGAAIGVLSGVAGGLLLGLGVVQLPTIGLPSDDSWLLASLAGAVMGAVVGCFAGMAVVRLDHATHAARLDGVFVVVRSDAARSAHAAAFLGAAAPGAQ